MFVLCDVSGRFEVLDSAVCVYFCTRMIQWELMMVCDFI